MTRRFCALLLAWVAAMLTLNTQGLRSEEPPKAPVPIPIGRLAIVTSESFGSSGTVDLLTGQQRITTQAYKTRGLEFLPDGKRFIYCASDAKAQGIYLYDLAEHTNVGLLKKMKDAESPSRSPDGTSIAFVLYAEGRESSQIYSANMFGSEVKPLTDGHCFNWSPRWSPDGKRLVFETTRHNTEVANDAQRDIYVMDADGQHQTHLTSKGWGHAPSWSPDGKFIAYMSYRGVWKMKADGSAKENLSHGKTRDSEPAWSPDGQWIAFTRTANNFPGAEIMDIWIMKSDGTEQRQVTFNQANAASYASSWGK